MDKKFIFNTYNKLSSSSPYLEFYTNKVGTFNPHITTTDSTQAVWLIDGFIAQNTNSPSFTLSGGTHRVRVQFEEFTSLSTLILTNLGILYDLDVSLFTQLQTLEVSNNIGLTSVITGTTKIEGVTVTANNSGIISYVNQGGLVESFYANNTLIQTITNLVNGVNPGALELEGVTSIESIDLSNFNISGELNLKDSSVVTLVGLNIIGDTNFNLKNSALGTALGSIHVDTLFDASGSDITYANILSANNGAFISFKDNGLSSTQINEMLFILDYSAVSGGIIELNGINGYVDSYSGGKDGWAFLGSLLDKSNTVEYNTAELELQSATTGTTEISVVCSEDVRVLVNDVEVTTGTGLLSFNTVTGDIIKLQPGNINTFTSVILTTGSIQGNVIFDGFPLETISLSNCPLLYSMSLATTGSQLSLILDSVGIETIDISSSSATSSGLLLNNLVNLTTIITDSITSDIKVTLCPNLNSITGAVNIDGVFNVDGSKLTNGIDLSCDSIDIRIINCNELSSIDLDLVTEASTFIIKDNLLLSSVLNIPVGTYNVDLSNNPLLTAVDLSPIINIPTELLLDNCNLNTITLPTTITDNSLIRLNDNNLTSAKVNEYLEMLDGLGLSNCTIYLDGNNSFVDATSGGIDGLQFRFNLITRGNTVYTNEADAQYIFNTNKDGLVTITTSGGTAIKWSDSNGGSGSGNVYSFINSGIPTTITMDVSGEETITLIDISNQGITGTISLSGMTGLDTLLVNGNASLYAINNLSSTVLNKLDISNTIITALDLSTITIATGSSGYIKANPAPALTSIFFGINNALLGSIELVNTSIESINLIYMMFEDITIQGTTTTSIDGINESVGNTQNISITNTSITTLDLNNADLGGTIIITGNELLTSITNIGSGSYPDLVSIDISDNNLTGGIDLSGYTVASEINISNNTGLTGITSIRGTADIILDGCIGLTSIDISPATIGNISAKNCTSLTAISNLSGTGSIDVSGCVALTSLVLTNFTILTSLIGNDSGIQSITGINSATYSVNLKNADLTGAIDFNGITVDSYFDVSDNPNLTSTSAITGTGIINMSDTGITLPSISGFIITGNSKFDNLDLTGIGVPIINNTSIINISCTGGITTALGMNEVIAAFNSGTTKNTVFDFSDTIGYVTSGFGASDGIAEFKALVSKLGVSVINAGIMQSFTSDASGSIYPVLTYTTERGDTKWYLDSVLTATGESPTLVIGGTSTTVGMVVVGYDKLLDVDLTKCSIVGALDLSDLSIERDLTLYGNSSCTSAIINTTTGVNLDIGGTAFTKIGGAGFPIIKNSINATSVGSITTFDTITYTGDHLDITIVGSGITTVNLVGIDLSGLNISYNASLTSVSNITSTLSGINIKLNDNDLTGTIDLDNIDMASLTLSNNTNLTTILNIGTGSFGALYIDNTARVGSLDISVFDTSNSTLNISNNTLTSVIVKSVSGSNTKINASNNNLTAITSVDTGTIWVSGVGIDLSNNAFTALPANILAPNAAPLDISNNAINGGPVDLTNYNIKTTLHLQDNADITDIILSTIAFGTDINVNSSITTVATINKFLVDLDNLRIQGCTINIGGTNPIPDGSTGGYDGLSAKTNLELNNTFV